MSLAYLEVVHVVSRCDLYSTGTLFRISVLVSDDRYLSSYERKDDCFAYKISISLVAFCYSDGDIRKHCLRTGCCDGDALAAVCCRISEIPVVTVYVLVLYFSIRKCGLAARAPVDDPVTLVDEALLIQADEHLVDCLVAAFVHRESFSSPVTGVTELAALTCDASAVLSLPLPCVLEELLTGHIVLVDSLLLTELLDYLDLGSDAGMVRSRQPQCRISLKSLPSCEDVLKCLVKCVTHMQLTCDVRRRHYDSERLLVLIDICIECTLLLPHLIDAVFELLRIICLC